jgi:preprotein translocase subunit YajC
MLSFAMPILAQAATTPPAPGASGPASMLPTVIFFGAVIAIVYFLMIRPQKKKEQERKNMLNKIEKGDRVVTVGGLHGEVESVKEDYVILLVDRENGHTLKFRRSAINEILPRDSGSAEDKQQ